MKKDEYTSEHLLEVCKLYQEHLGGHGIGDFVENPFGELESLLEEIQKNGGTRDNYRIGSKYDFHTKLGFRTDWQTNNVVPDVNLNFDPSDRQGPRYEEAQETVKLFMKEVTEYLSQHSAK